MKIRLSFIQKIQYLQFNNVVIKYKKNYCKSTVTRAAQ